MAVADALPGADGADSSAAAEEEDSAVPLREALREAWDGKSYYDRLASVVDAGRPPRSSARRKSAGASRSNKGGLAAPPEAESSGSPFSRAAAAAAAIDCTPTLERRSPLTSAAAAAPVSCVWKTNSLWDAPPPAPRVAKCVPIPERHAPLDTPRACSAPALPPALTHLANLRERTWTLSDRRPRVGKKAAEEAAPALAPPGAHAAVDAARPAEAAHAPDSSAAAVEDLRARLAAAEAALAAEVREPTRTDALLTAPSGSSGRFAHATPCGTVLMAPPAVLLPTARLGGLCGGGGGHRTG